MPKKITVFQWSILVIAFLLNSVSTAYGKGDSLYLIKPTGPFDIGTMTYYWEDHSRNYKFSSHPNDPRVIPVQFWYPGIKTGQSQKAPYAGLFPDYEKVSTNSYLRLAFSDAIDSVQLIFIIPGRAFERFAYTQIAEDLASQGFLVVSVDIPEIGYVSYPDGYLIPSSERFRPSPELMTGPYEKVDLFFQQAVDLALKDLNFVLNKIKDLDESDPSNRFFGKINTSNIGIFGHSLGGRIAGAFAAQNPEIRALVTSEAVPSGEIRLKGKLKCPSLMLCTSSAWFQAEQYYREFIDNRSNRVIMCELIDFGENSISDGPLLYPRTFRYKVNPVEALNISRKLLLNFFNQELRQRSDFSDDIRQYVKVKYEIFDKKE